MHIYLAGSPAKDGRHKLHVFTSPWIYLIDQDRVSDEQGILLLFVFLSLTVYEISKSQTHTQHHTYTTNYRARLLPNRTKGAVIYAQVMPSASAPNHPALICT